MSDKLNNIDRPVFIIGAARSGTTLLSKFFLNHPDVYYCSEPNAVWKKGHFKFNHDVLAADHADEATCRFIREYFWEQLRSNQKTRLVEKTPTNCLRISFVHKIFPDARFIHIVRDGRDVALSAYKKSTGNIQQVTSSSQRHQRKKFETVAKSLKKHLNQQELTFTNLIHLCPHYIRSTLNILNIMDYKTWGPKFIGMKEYTNFYSPIETAALQWKICVETVENYFQSNSVEHILIKYENLLERPHAILNEIFDYCELKKTENFDNIVKKNVKKKIGAGARQTTDKMAHPELDQLLYITLRHFGYV